MFRSSSSILLTLIAGATIIDAACLTGISSERKAKAKSSFASAKLIPGPVAASWNPTLDVQPFYGTKAVNFGNVFSTTETVKAPVIKFDAEPGYDPSTTNYSILIVDPDAPSPKAPALRFFLHEIQYNVHPSCTADSGMKDATTFAPYLSLTSLSLAKHRYNYLVYRQPEGTYTPMTQLAEGARAPFHLKEYAKDTGLTLVGGNFMRGGLNSLGARDEHE